MQHTVYLLRHCDYENPHQILPGRLPVPLSAQGAANAQRLRAEFAQHDIRRIYSSAVLRCRQTAEIIAGEDIPVLFDQRLLETLSAYQGYWGDNEHAGGYHFFSHRDELGGESLADLAVRLIDFWDTVILPLRENVIICSHGDPLQVLYAHIHDLPLVDDNAKESDIPGWLEKGQYAAITFDEGQRVSTTFSTIE